MPKLNKPAKPGYQYRSPGQTSARSMLPHLKEDVGASTRADVERVKKGLTPPEENPGRKRTALDTRNRGAQMDAGNRAISRLAGRAGAVGAAGAAGYDLGRLIDEKTGIGEKLVDAALRMREARQAARGAPTPEPASPEEQSSAREPMATVPTRGSVGLGPMPSRAAPAPAPAPAPRAAARAARTARAEPAPAADSAEATRERALRWARAMNQGEDLAEGYAAGGMVGGKRNRGDGCAQRGLTKGKMV